MKILWAPVVDAAYVARFGRRKTWLIPCQLCIGLVMIGLAFSLDSLLYVSSSALKGLFKVF